MNINKAIRKQSKSYKRFLLSMSFVFFLLPFFLNFYKKFTIFYVAYLSVIEVLILISIIISSNKELLKFEYKNGKLKIEIGVKRESVNIICKKILYVDVELEESRESKFRDFKIIMLSNSKFNNKKMKKANPEFIKKYTRIAYHYDKFRLRKPEDEFYYLIINDGGLNKYKLLDTIYKSCVYAVFSEDAVERIKTYRDYPGQV
jgi:hypothetical protein